MRNQVLDREEINTNNLNNEYTPRKERKKKKSKFKKFLITLLILFIIGISSFAFLLYGPYPNFREWLITTAMTTMTHQYLATWFYSDDTIQEVLNKNRVAESEETTDPTLTVIVDENKNVEYANEYEKAILEKDPGNDDYKIINIEGKGYSGYLAAIYDPSRIKTVVTKKLGKCGQYLKTMADDNDALLAINGGGFIDPNYNSNGANPLGITFSEGRLITSNVYSGAGGLIGFTNENKLVLGKMSVQEAKDMNVRDAVTFGPFLIVNGKASEVLGNGGWGTAPRTAIGQRKDGIVLFLVIDGRTVKKPGADMNDLIEIMQRYGAYNAANLDGGTSSVMYVDGKIINDPIDSTGAHKTRFISTGFILTKKESSQNNNVNNTITNNTSSSVNTTKSTNNTSSSSTKLNSTNNTTTQRTTNKNTTTKKNTTKYKTNNKR